MNRRQFIASAAALAATAAVPAFADAYPERMLKLLVPFPPGGGTDTAARIVMKKLSEQLGQPIVVENRPGAGGAVAYNELLRNKPDGYTLTIGSGNTVAHEPDERQSAVQRRHRHRAGGADGVRADRADHGQGAAGLEHG